MNFLARSPVSLYAHNDLTKYPSNKSWEDNRKYITDLDNNTLNTSNVDQWQSPDKEGGSEGVRE
ncbi:MAG: hypothetical protein AAF630_14740 [Cyanobacteria bacterium P01_C01_bin.38]